jgi:SAM-dependent methyltransferase
MSALTSDDHVVLDPAVRIEELPVRKRSRFSQGPALRRGWLVLHDESSCAAVIPGGEGIVEFLERLRAPTLVDDLVAPEDIGTDAIPWQLLDNLSRRGFAHRVVDREHWRDQLDTLRSSWRSRSELGRRVVRVGGGSRGDLAQMLREHSIPPSLVITRDHELAMAPALLDRLVELYHRGELRLHDVIVEGPGPCSRELRRALVSVQASVRLPGFDEPTIAELLADGIPVIVRVTTLPERERLDELARLVKSSRVTGLELDIPWQRLDGAAGARAAEVYDHVSALADDLGDVRIVGFATDDEIAQEAVAEAAPISCEIERAARRLHLERRARYLAEIEGHAIWAQLPDAEQRWVPLEHDLLPNHPELLDLNPTSVIADIAGGFGRVARRLAPHAARVISIEREPLFVARARRFAASLGATTLQFRVGLCQRLPLANDSVDAAVLEWGGDIHRSGLLGAGVAEMNRIIRPGRRIAITYRLCNLLLDNVTEVFASAPDIYAAVRDALVAAGLEIVAERFWCVQPRYAGAPLVAFEERFLPRVVDDLRARTPTQPDSIDVTATIVGRKSAARSG